METTPGKRVQMLREAKGYTSLTAFAEFTKIKVGTLSALEKDKSSPSLETMAKLIEAFPDANLDWLVTGQGPMLKDGRTLTPVPTSSAQTEPDTAPAGGSKATEAVAETDSQPPTNKLRINRDGENDGYWKGVAGERLKRIEQLELTNERLWGQNTELLKKPDASLDAADLYETVDQIHAEYFPTTIVELPEIQRFPIGRKPCVERQMNIGFGRQQQA